MSVESFATAVSPSRRRRERGPRLVGAEFLKLRKRRGLVLSSLGLTVVPMLVGYTVVAVQHASDPDRHGPGGGVENFVPSIGLLSGLVAIVAILIGVTAGTGDLRAGVFRELVITGRSRLSLFAARIPGGLALLLPFAAAGFVTAAVASIVLAGGEPTPGFRLLVLTGAWIGLAAALTFVLALGVSSVVGSTGPSIGILLGWQLLARPAPARHRQPRVRPRSAPRRRCHGARSRGPRGPVGTFDGPRCDRCEHRALDVRAPRRRCLAHEHAGRLRGR